MTADEIKSHFRAGATGPLYAALCAVLDDNIETETRAALFPNLTDESRQYQAGRAAALTNLRDELNELITPPAP
jgi:hypothetical protein